MESKSILTNDIKEKPLLTVKETAEFLNIGVQTIYNRTSSKAKNPFPFKVKRIGGSLRFRREDLVNFINSDTDK